MYNECRKCCICVSFKNCLLMKKGLLIFTVLLCSVLYCFFRFPHTSNVLKLIYFHFILIIFHLEQPFLFICSIQLRLILSIWSLYLFISLQRWETIFFHILRHTSPMEHFKFAFISQMCNVWTASE